MTFDNEFFFLLAIEIYFVNPVMAKMTLQEHQGNDKSCVWHAVDFADGLLKEETFCIRFSSLESELIIFYNSHFVSIMSFLLCSQFYAAGLHH